MAKQRGRQSITLVPLTDPFLPFVAAADLLHADAEADMVKHAIVRGALMNALVNNSRVLAIFDEWSRRTGIGGLTVAIAKTLDKIAVSADLDGRASLFMEGTSLAGVGKADVGEVCQHLAIIGERIVQYDGLTLPDILAGLTFGKFGLRWTFVPFELHRAYCLLVQERIMGWMFEMVTHVDVVPEIRPVTELLIGESLKGLDAVTVLAKLKAICAAIEGRLSARPRAGRRPKNDGAYLERFAHWYYRHRVCGESVRNIARGYSEARLGPGNDADDRPTVMHGIAEAERLLNLASARFR
jgi:hypothetical protein